MNIVIWLVLLTAVKPAPTFVVLHEFPSQQRCQEEVHEIVVKQHFTEEQAKLLKCLPIITDPIKDA